MRLAHYDDESYGKLKEFFNQLDSSGDGMLGAAEIEELLVSFGLATDRADVERIVCDLHDDGSGRLDFQEFVKLLKEVLKLADKNYLERHDFLYNEQNEADESAIGAMKAKLGKLFPPLTDVKKLHVSKEREKYNDMATEVFFKRLRKANSKTPNE